MTMSTTPASIALSKDLKRRGWTFVGPTTVYAFMQAMGLVNDHVEGCFVREATQCADDDADANSLHECKHTSTTTVRPECVSARASIVRDPQAHFASPCHCALCIVHSAFLTR